MGLTVKRGTATFIMCPRGRNLKVWIENWKTCSEANRCLVSVCEYKKKDKEEKDNGRWKIEKKGIVFVAGQGVRYAFCVR